MRRLLLYERRSTRSRFIGVGGGNCDLKPFYGDFVSLHRRAQLPRHPSDATPSFIKKGTARGRILPQLYFKKIPRLGDFFISHRLV